MALGSVNVPGKLTATDVGASAANHTHTAAQVGADASGSAAAVRTSLNSHTGNKSNPHGVTAAQAGAVPTGRKVNGKTLTGDISLSAADVGAVPTARKVNNKALSADISLSAADVGAAAAGHTHTAAQVGAAAANHTHTASDIPTASTSAYGATKLSSSVSSTSTTLAATPSAVKQAYDLANQALAAAGAAQADATVTLEALKKALGGSLPSKTLSENSPDVIQKVAAAGLGANFWSVGDKIGIALNGTVGSLALSGTYYAYIIGFNHNSGIEGNGIHFQFGKTSGGTNIAFCDAGYCDQYSSNADSRFVMNTTDTNAGGWANSYMRNTICPSFLEAMPAAWRSIIAPCIKYSDNTGGGRDTASYVTVTVDKIWLLSEFEVHGSRTYANSAEKNYQKQYDYYKNGNSKVKYKHNSTGSAFNWWLRSVYAGYTRNFCYVRTSGDAEHNYTYYSYGFAPGFKVA